MTKVTPEAALVALANAQASSIFRALPDGNVRAGLPTHQLAELLNVPPSSVSRQLSSLRNASLASTRSERLVLYSRLDEAFREFIELRSSWFVDTN